jgi:hypothetical protein
MPENKVNHDCNKCKNGYFASFDSSSWHNLCGAGHCYLCQLQYGGKCVDYEEGSPPANASPM